MNWLLIIILIALLCFALYGTKKGAIRLVFTVVEILVLTIIIGLLVTNVLAFLGIFIVAVIVLHLISKALKLFAHLPVIRGIDRFFGFFVGIFLGLIFVWIFFWIVSVLGSTGFGTMCLSYINASPILSLLYQNNGVQIFASQHFTWYNL